jgi:hypothetical protein
MNNNHHAVGMVGGIASPNGAQAGPSIAMAFHKGNGANKPPHAINTKG